MTDTSLQVLATRLDHVANTVDKLQEILTDVAQSLNKLAIVEERQAAVTETLKHVYDKVDTLEERIRTLEIAEPMQTQTSTWVLNGIWGIVGAAMAYAAAKIFGG